MIGDPLEANFRRIIREEIEAALRRHLELSPPPPPALPNAMLVTIGQAAAMTGQSSASVRKRLNTGKLTAYGKGRGARVDPAELKRVMAGEAAEKERPITDAEIEERVNRALSGEKHRRNPHRSRP